MTKEEVIKKLERLAYDIMRSAEELDDRIAEIENSNELENIEWTVEDIRDDLDSVEKYLEIFKEVCDG